MEVRGQLHAPATSPPGKEPLLPIGYEAAWSQSRSGHDGEKKNSQPELPIIQPVAERYTTELSRLLNGSLQQTEAYVRIKLLLTLLMEVSYFLM
jgi:hypothetical protein